MALELPIGMSDFKELIEEKYHFIDKSLFIRDVCNNGSKVTLIPRPRRFGKTITTASLLDGMGIAVICEQRQCCLYNGVINQDSSFRKLTTFQ